MAFPRLFKKRRNFQTMAKLIISTDQVKPEAGQFSDFQKSTGEVPSPSPTAGLMSNLPKEIIYRIDDFASEPDQFYQAVRDLLVFCRLSDLDGAFAENLVFRAHLLLDFFRELERIDYQQKRR
jgi:hypothetical protein